METSPGLTFVNRGAELAFLTDCLKHLDGSAALIVIRSPPGFGKSRLTDELSARSAVLPLKFCTVDPSIRARTGTARLHDGFFLQQCAAELSTIAETNKVQWKTLKAFLRERRWTTAREKRPVDAVSELPSLGHAYRIAFDYCARLFGYGRFSPRQLLLSDQSDAVQICTNYVEQALTAAPIVLIVREVQHSDLDSLRNLLRMNRLDPGPDLILEYTCEGTFEPEHQKLFLRTAERHKNFHILDLVRLEAEHLEYLIRDSVSSNFTLTSNFYLSWDGNLRSIIELKFQVGIGRKITNADQIESVLGNLGQTLQAHISRLSPLQRLILAVVTVHIEAVDRWTLTQAVTSIDPRTASSDLNHALHDLIDRHSFLTQVGESYRIQNETVALSLADAPSVRPLIALAEKALRDHYSRVIDRSVPGPVGISTAVRQLFRLCARTKDAAGLLRATEILLAEVKQAQDQSIYVEIVASALETDSALYKGDYEELVNWAASLAYDICDWSRCANLSKLADHQNSFTKAMRACALQEIGRHDEALLLAAEFDTAAAQPNERLIGALVEAIIVGCRGQHQLARLKLEELISSAEYSNSPLLGYAYRFFDVIAELDECCSMLEASIDWFERFEFSKSRAYSQLPTAVILARTGNIDSARSLINEAQKTLANEVRDQHMILNNKAVVELLDDNPDFMACKETLAAALRLARDDYSELTILTNLGIAYLGANDLGSAVDCVEKSIPILMRHDFEDVDIFWPVCFNAGRIFYAAGLDQRRLEILRFPREHGRPVLVNKEYWAYRYGESTELDERYSFMASRPHHPLYLSHWIIDLEGLSLLKSARRQ